MLTTIQLLDQERDQLVSRIKFLLNEHDPNNQSLIDQCFLALAEIDQALEEKSKPPIA